MDGVWLKAGRRLSAPLLVVLMMLPLMGCANHIFRQFDIDGDAQSLSVDAKQRMVLVTHKGGKTRDRTVVCTEPSPDAISALAASGALSGAATVPAVAGGAAPQGSFNASGSSNEVVASIAMRSQTIQLLRDGLFRACEAYMNGAIDQHQYNVILLNIDRLMVNLVGVDAVGGTAKGGSGGASGGEIQSEAMTNMVMSANAHSSVPSLCISLLASGELRRDNHSQALVMARCDYLLDGTMRKLVNRPAPQLHGYKVSPAAADAALASTAAVTPPVASPVPVVASEDAIETPPAKSEVAGWTARTKPGGDGWNIMTTVNMPTTVHEVADASRSTLTLPASPQVPPLGWETRTKVRKAPN